MGRAPCCEKMGLKKGPWTPEEDRILIAHIQKHGHANWRALPKQAGLLRCGKSCRLRWINYLRPDIKRGNFTVEEEETIIKLHEMLGNRWSAIAARLPGRTDNEIKNVWHTHLKKRVLRQNQVKNSDTEENWKTIITCDSNITTQSESDNSNLPINSGSSPMSPQPSSSDLSSVTTASLRAGETNQYMDVKDEQIDSFEDFPQIDESFWTDPVSDENSSIFLSEFGGIIDEFQLQSQFTSTDHHQAAVLEQGYDYNRKDDDDSMDFWYNILLSNGGESTVPFFQ